MQTDILGAPYEAEPIPLADDAEGPVEATLVRRLAGPSTSRTVLHVHGFADYFFQTVAADFWVDRGYDFHALDLRKHGRSLRAHQSPNMVADLAVYYEELDAVWTRLSASYDEVVLSGHSTGGLTLPLWLHDRGHRPAGVFLNSPWLAMQGDFLTRTLLMPLAGEVGRHRPRAVVPRSVSGYYARSLHRDCGGEWTFDLTMKPLRSFPVHAGWLRAIRAAHARVASGLDVHAPILVVTSARSGSPESPDSPDIGSTDIVLDVERIRRCAPLLGPHVTIAMIEGALHDVTLSPQPARSQVFSELARFLGAYVEA